MLSSTDMHILVVSDVATARRVMIHLLKELGYWKISEATDVDMALRAFKNALSVRSPIDFLVSGFCDQQDATVELIEKVRKIDILATIPILLMATNATRKAVAEAVHAGADACIVAPFRATRMLQKMEELGRKTRTESTMGNATPSRREDRLHEHVGHA